MIDTNWIEDLLKKSKENTKKENKAHTNPLEFQLIKKLIEHSYEIHKCNPEIPLGRILASAFDLVVSADYYSTVGHKGWYFCPSPVPNLFYHFTNCCPRHALGNLFHFHQSSKPESGSIGKSTSRLLRNFLIGHLEKRNRPEIILKGSEPVDIVIVNEITHEILFGEIKASPLLTVPLIMDSEALTDSNGDVITHHHGNDDLTLNKVFGQQMSLFIPKKVKGHWVDNKISFGQKNDADDRFWGYRSMITLLGNDGTFLKAYYEFWDEALTKYHPRMTENIFWLTNGCGAPNPRPDDWPRAKKGEGDGYESISDSKTSVGMDRTDDIKKGIYQVLKLGSEGKPVESKWKFKVGIVSNIHAARHFEEYLESLKNLIWTHDATGKVRVAGDLDDDHKLFNLFDGIIALSECHFRDDWLKQVFGLD